MKNIRRIFSFLIVITLIFVTIPINVFAGTIEPYNASIILDDNLSKTATIKYEASGIIMNASAYDSNTTNTATVSCDYEDNLLCINVAVENGFTSNNIQIVVYISSGTNLETELKLVELVYGKDSDSTDPIPTVEPTVEPHKGNNYKKLNFIDDTGYKVEPVYGQLDVMSNIPVYNPKANIAYLHFGFNYDGSEKVNIIVNPIMWDEMMYDCTYQIVDNEVFVTITLKNNQFFTGSSDPDDYDSGTMRVCYEFTVYRVVDSTYLECGMVEPIRFEYKKYKEEETVESFIERLYNYTLNRRSDPEGKANWIHAVQNGATGADVATGFLFSPEFLNKDQRYEDFVSILYKVFFNREPDNEGLKSWVKCLEEGVSKTEIISGFINSTEWANMCLKYGIKPGGTGQANIVIEPTDNVKAFVKRLYVNCLGRNPDPQGLNDWASLLVNMKISGEKTAYGFFHSDEFKAKKLTDEEYIKILYETCLDRTADSAGLEAWLKVLENGYSRDYVLDGFIHSREFGSICIKYRIVIF